MSRVPSQFTVDQVWQGRPSGPAFVEIVGERLRVTPLDRMDAHRHSSAPHLPGSLLPGLVDAHVHLGLVHPEALAATPVVEVHDLGWIPRVARRWRLDQPTGGRIRIAGAFLTAVGGYPAGRDWAPEEALCELATREAAVRAVEEAAAFRHDLVKVVLHSGLPLLGEQVLTALVEAAHARGLPVGVHAEGADQARRAFEAGADVLVHAPWTERVSDALLAAMAQRMTWVSTLGIHSGADRERAVDNARRFVAAGGRLRYGTDLGNGPGPVGQRADEILALGDAGLDGDALLEALTGPPTRSLTVATAVCAPLPVPTDASSAADWFSRAHRLRPLLQRVA